MKVRQAALFGAVSIVFATAAFAQPRDHLTCYAAKPTKKICVNPVDAGKLCEEDLECSAVLDACGSPPKFPKDYVARLDDVNVGASLGEDKSFNVKKPTRLCVPVDKNDEGILDAPTSYMTYPIKQTKMVCVNGSIPGMPCKETVDCGGGGTCIEPAGFDATQNTNILVEDQYSNIRVNAAKVDFLMVPASRCNGDNDATCVVGGNAAPAADSRDHYKCYKAKATKTVCGLGFPNALEACDEDLDCGGTEDSCVGLPKFTKGQDAYLLDFNGDFMTAERTFGVSKLTHFCKAVEKTVPPTGTPEGPVNPKARMLCYKSKASKGQCDANDPNNPINDYGACKKDEDCGGVSEMGAVECVLQAKFNKEDVDVLGLYVNDQFDLVPGSGPTSAGDYHRSNLSKEDLFCMPACEPALIFNHQVLRANFLQIPGTGHLGDGQNVDNLPTCQPGSCSMGVDNALGYISGAIPDLNTALQDAVEAGDINILLELNDFVTGAGQTVNGYTGDEDAACDDVNDPNETCGYEVGNAEVDASTCDATSDISFTVTVGSTASSPTTVSGGGIGSNLSFSLPFGELPIEITAHNVKVSADVTHTAGVVQSATGALGGAINQRELKAAINSLPEGICDGPPNDGDPCTVATEVADCNDNDPNSPMVFCDTGYLGGFDKATVANFIDTLLVRDIDLDGMMTCEGGDGGGGDNAGEPCTMSSECPFDDGAVVSPPACTPYDASSIGIKFTGINALITGRSNDTCTKGTCSIY